MNLSPGFLAGAPKEAKDLISRSLGLNFGSVAVGAGFRTMPAEPQLPGPLRKVAAEIFAFDILMQNFDRKRDNPNLLWDGKSIVLIDHESALHSVLTWPKPAFANLDLEHFYDHVFYAPISPKDADFQRLVLGLQALTPAVLDGFFGQIPAAWRDEAALARAREYLNFVVDNRDSLCQLVYGVIS